jgi:hypothetical protein
MIWLLIGVLSRRAARFTARAPALPAPGLLVIFLPLAAWDVDGRRLAGFIALRALRS